MHSADRSARPHTRTISHPSVGHLAHKIDLGEIIQFHFTFSCFGTLPAATSVLPEVRKLWTRQSPAAVNGTPYSLYEFPVNLQITSNTIALHSGSVLRLHVYLTPISDYLPAAASSPWSPSGRPCGWEPMRTGRGPLQPQIRSKPTEPRREARKSCTYKFPAPGPAPLLPPPHALFFLEGRYGHNPGYLLLSPHQLCLPFP